ncbi:unnamed protein product [Sympodiomycopsis kandeliae]
MFQTSIWRPNQSGHCLEDPLNRPIDYTSQRQDIAKRQGRTHFQLATNTMASSPSSSSTPHHSSSSRGRSRSVRHLWAYSPERARIEVREEEDWYREKKERYRAQQQAKQRELQQQEQQQQQKQQKHSQTPSHLLKMYQGALSLFEQAREIISVDAPDGDLEKHGQNWVDTQSQAASLFINTNNDSTLPHQEAQFAGQRYSGDEEGWSSSSSPSASTQSSSSAEGLTDSALDGLTGSTAASSVKALAAPRHEPPPASTSLLPILARPPPDLDLPTKLEQRAYGAEEGSDADKGDDLSYLHPPQAEKEGHDALLSSPVLYTRSQLPTLDLGSRYLWHALHQFRAVTDDYAIGYAQEHMETPHPLPSGQGNAISMCPFVSSSSAASQSATDTVRRIFNWSSLELPLHLSQTWYGVIFRSIRREGSESINLYEDDRLSHEEAVGSGGLILYWYGLPNTTTGENVASCIWTSREDAIIASRLPMHARAAKHSQAAYEKFDLARYKVVKEAGRRDLLIQEWQD